MSRAGTGRDRSRWRVVGGQCGVFRIEAIDKDLVQTEITRKGKAVDEVGVDAMRVRSSLTLQVHARTGVLNCGGWRAKTSVLAYRQRRDAAAAVVRHQHAAAFGVHRQVTRAEATRRLLVERSELARLWRDEKSVHRTGTFAFK